MQIKNHRSLICLLQITFCIVFITSKVEATTPSGAWFIGCFPDTGLLTNFQTVSVAGNTVGYDTNFTESNALECAVKCSGANVAYKYGAFSQTGLCLCSNTPYNITGAVSNSLCSHKACDLQNETSDCEGNTYHWLINASKMITDVDITTTGILRGAVPQNITVTTVPADLNAVFNYQFGDGNSLDYITERTFSYIYLDAGYYKLTVNAQANFPKSATVSDSKILHVETQPYGVHMQIPAAVETELQHNFTASIIEGNNMTVSAVISIGATDILGSGFSGFFADDASLYAIGASISELLRASVLFSSPNSGIYIMPNFKFPVDGIVAGFEVFVTKVGFLRFQAYRPICSSGVYCYSLNTCNSTCSDTVDMMTNTTYLITTDLSNSTSPAPPATKPNYKLVSEISLNANATGLKYLKAKSSSFAVERGDVIAVKLSSTEGDIGHEVLSSAWEYHANPSSEVFPGTVISSLTTTTGKKHLIRAHLSTTTSFQLTAKFTEPGVANIKIKAKNSNFPEYNGNRFIHVQERIVDFSVTVPKPENEIAYEVKQLMTLTSTKVKGSNVTFDWKVNLGNLNFTYNNTEGTQPFTPSSVGIYSLFASAKNLLGQENVTMAFRVQERIADLIIVDLVGGLLLSQASSQFSLSTKVINGTNVTLSAEYDGTVKNTTINSLSGGEHLHTFAFPPPPDGACTRSKAKVTAANMIQGGSIVKEFDVGILCPITRFEVNTDPTLSKTNKTTTGRNIAVTVTITITQGSYVIYRIDKGDGTTDIKNHSSLLKPETVTFTLNYASASTYTVNVTAENPLPRSLVFFEFEVEVSDCPPELLEITGSPQADNPAVITRGLDYKVTGNIITPNCSVPKVLYSVEFYSIDENDENNNLDSRNIAKENLQYIIKKLTRPAGKYKIVFNQVINTDKGPLKNVKTAYLHIKQTPLLALIDSGSSRRVPLKKTLNKAGNATSYYSLQLDGSPSYDPDNKSTPLQYKWLCRSKNFSIPVNRSGQVFECNSTNYMPYPDRDQKLVIRDSGSKTSVDTKFFAINTEYDFLLVVSDITRTSNYSQKITFVRGNPPAVEFQCITNCDNKWNIQEKLILRCQCPQCVDVQKIVYEWKIEYGNGSQVFTASQQEDEKITSTGFAKQNLVINAGQLQANEQYTVTLVAKYSDGKGEYTKITLSRRTAILPYGGTCKLLPSVGTVAETKFQIQCDNWECPDLPIKYEFTTKTKLGEGQGVSVSTLSRTDYPIWYSGYEPRNPKSILPLGDPDNGYNLTLIVRIFNAYGSFTELDPIIATVKSIDTSSGKSAALVIESSKPETKDPAPLSQWATSAASVLNQEKTSSSSSDTANTRTEIIKSLAGANLKEISITNLKQFGEALGAVLSKTDEVNEAGQDASTNLLDKMADSFLNNDEANAGAETFEQASTAIMGPLSDLMQMTTTKTEGYLKHAKDNQEETELRLAAPTQTTPTARPTNRPTQKQIKEEADKTKNSTRQYMGIMDKLSEKLLKTKVAGEKAMIAKTASFSLALEKRDLGSLAKEGINTGGDGPAFMLPDNIFSEIVMNGTALSDTETEISCQGSAMKKILHTWDLDNAQNSASEIQSLKLVSRSYAGMNVSNLTSDITIKIQNRPEKLKTSSIKLNFPQEMTIRKERIKSYDSPLLVEFGSPDNSTSNFTILIQFGYPPTRENYDAKLVITSDGIQLSKSSGNVSVNASSSSNATFNGSSTDQPLTRNAHIRVIDGKTIILWDFKNFTYAFLGNKDVYFNFYYTGAMPDPVYVPNEYTYDILELRRSRNYTMRTFSCSCLYWSSKLDKWTDDGCKVDPYRTTFNETVCKCNHLTSFGGFYVKPTPIPPLSADMFLKGYVLFVAVTVTLLFFILGLVLARRADKRDLLKVGVCPLPDNNPDHHYLYQITVWTGLRRNGGTKSNVYFILSGDNGDTEIRHLKDPERTTFQQNSSDLFIFSTESSLGDLSHLRIWHDNSGGGWYLRKIVITDLQKDKTFQFLCNRWLAVDKEDGQIEMVAPVSGKDDLKDFNYVFMTKTRSDLSDSHLWFSLYARSPRSPFTRCQRLACCVSLLMTSMMASAMFYNTFPPPTPETANYAAGLTFTWKQVYVAVISAAITVPINIIIVTLFRSSRPKEVIDVKKKNPSRAGSKASLADNISLKSSDSSATLSSPESPVFNKTGEEPLLAGDAEKGKVETKEEKKKETYLFPHWCVYVAWFLVFVSIVSSSVVVIIYGMVFGNSTSLEWLSSIILGFVQDIIVIQPVKIFVIAVIFAAVIKSVQDERPTIEEHGKKLAEDEEWLHANADTTLGSGVDTSTLRPPDGVKLDAMRELRFKERKMYAIVREILLYCFFVLVTFSISYSLREESGFWETNGLQQLFKLDLKEKEQFNKDRFTGVLSEKDFWFWAESSLIAGLFPQPWYSQYKDYPTRTKDFPGRLFINDLNHKIVNGVRLRQVRVKPSSCTKNKDVKGVIKIDCAAPYSMGNEDKTNFISNWTNQINNRPPITRSNQPWLYQTWQELDGYPFMAELATYFGGGYTQELFPRWPNKENLDRLKKARWLDRHTRAVIIEFALFNPGTNHFSMVTITFEFAATGGVIHYHSVYTFKLYRYTTGFAFYTVVCEVVFVILLLLYIYRECKEFYQLRWQYFGQFWNLIEVAISILAFVAIGFYVYRQKLAKDLLQKLPSKKPQTFINFQFAAYIDQIFIYVVALIVFFVSIKFIKLLRFNRRMSILADTLKHSWKPLGMFSIVMGIVLTSTFAFATIVFGRQMYGYRNMLVTAATQISLLLGKFDFNEYQNTNRVIGPIFFFLYIIMVNWILLNMFLSIINDSYEVVSDDLREQSNDYEIVDFVVDQFKTWLGVGKTRKEEIAQNIRWQSANAKVRALRAFSANSKTSKKRVCWSDDDILSGLTKSSYWHDNPAINEAKDLDAEEVNKTVDRFIECINMLYFDDSDVAHKMTKKVKQEISDFDYFEQEKAGKN